MKVNLAHMQYHPIDCQVIIIMRVWSLSMKSLSSYRVCPTHTCNLEGFKTDLALIIYIMYLLSIEMVVNSAHMWYNPRW